MLSLPRIEVLYILPTKESVELSFSYVPHQLNMVQYCTRNSKFILFHRWKTAKCLIIVPLFFA